MNSIKCPGCGKEVEFVRTQDGLNCPQCGSPPPAAVSAAKTNWLIFGIACFAPTLLTILSVLAKSKDLPPLVAVFGGGLSGIICGTMLGRRFGRTTGLAISLAVLFSVLLGAACIAMNCFGCLASGFQVNF